MSRLLITAVLLMSPAAFAHGRAPYPVSVAPHPSNGRVLVGTTYGLLVSQGEAFHWICEQAPGYSDTFDPKLVWAADGTMFAALPQKVARSSDDGCTWTDVAGFSSTGASELIEDPTATGTYWATTARFGSVNALFRSQDGVTFSATSLAQADTYFTGVAVAPSDAQRIYVSAWFGEPLAAWLYTSADRGVTFTKSAPALPGASGFKVLAVSPIDPSILFANVFDAQAQSLLLRSTDSGATWQALVTTDDVVRSLWISQDGRRAYVATAKKLYESVDDGATFTALSGWSTNACIGGNESELWACGRPPNNPYLIGSFAPGQAGAVTPRLVRNEDLKGPLQCPAGTPTGDLCPARWPELASVLNIQLAADGGVLTGNGGADVQPDAEEGACGCGAGDAAVPLLALAFAAVRRRVRVR